MAPRMGGSFGLEKKRDTHTQNFFWCWVWILESLINNHKGVETWKENKEGKLHTSILEMHIEKNIYCPFIGVVAILREREKMSKFELLPHVLNSKE